MSIEDSIRTAAREVVKAAVAVKPCPLHAEVLVRIGDERPEHRAFELAATAAKKECAMEWRETIMDELATAVDGECPECRGLCGPQRVECLYR